MQTLPTASPVKYGFYERLNSTFPSQLIIDTTEICNLACIHCPHPTFKKSELYGGRNQAPELSAKAIDEVREHGKGITQYIRYTGEGEPTFHPHFFEMVEYAVKNSGTTVSVTTNGTTLTKRRIDQLLATGVDLIDISIDAFSPEVYAKIRVNGNLDVTRPNVLALIDASRGSKTKVVVSYVEQPANMHETKDFEAFWRDSGAAHVVVRRLHSSAGAVSGVAATMREEQVAEARRPCLYPWERILLNPRGELAYCPQDWVHGSGLADYRTTTIKETWQGEAYRKLRQAHLDNAFADHQFCGQCPDWKATNWPNSGARAYADMVQDFKSKE